MCSGTQHHAKLTDPHIQDLEWTQTKFHGTKEDIVDMTSLSPRQPRSFEDCSHLSVGKLPCSSTPPNYDHFTLIATSLELILAGRQSGSMLRANLAL